MLRSVENIKGYPLNALDGEIGKVKDFLFDDESWYVRYMVADTGSWLESRLVLISTKALGEPDWIEKQLPVNLTKQRIENSPGIEAHKPVSRQHEINLSDYYGWPYYWTGTAGSPGVVPLINEDPLYALNNRMDPTSRAASNREASNDRRRNEKQDPHLRSTSEVKDYKIKAVDGEIGNVEDFIVDDDFWNIRYLVVDTGNWLLPGKKVLMALQWIKSINWNDSTVEVDLTAEEIKGSPEYHPDEIINRDYEAKLFSHYNRGGEGGY